MPELIYKKKEVKINASMLSGFSDCEFQWACKSLIDGLPPFPKPIYLVFGGVISKFQERLYKAGPAEAEGVYKYGIVYLQDVLNGRSIEGKPPVEIRWLTSRQMSGLTSAVVKEKIEEKRNQYIGKGVLALRALFLERVAPSPYERVEVEYDIGKHGLTIKNRHTGDEYLITGRVDKIGFLPGNDEYDVFDDKTGEAQREYRRNKIVRDIQMTIYQYALEKVFGRLPRAMYIQPLNLSGAFLKANGERALEKMRIPVDIRKDPTHYENLTNLASDVSFVIDSITHPNKYDAGMLKDWEPESYWGKMAEFRQNIEEGRFIPRVGDTWCGNCQFLDLCRQANSADWEKYEKKVRSVHDGGEIPVPAVAGKKREPEELTLFGLVAKIKSPGKSDKEIKKQMKKSGRFLSPRDIQAQVRKWHALIPLADGHLCPCRRLGLVPTVLLERFQGIRENKVAIKDVLAGCPYDGCPFREDNAKPA